MNTAAQLARALGVTARAVLQRLRAVPADGSQTVRGQTAKAWSLPALPDALRADLATAAAARGLLVEQLLSPVAPWTSPVPWHLVPETFRTKAEKLCAALAPALAKQHQLSGPDLMDLARSLYRQHHGNTLADDKLRYIMDRAAKRDHGAGQWQRPDLYLDDAAFHSAAAPSATANPHTELDTAVKLVKDKSNPTLDDRAYLLHAAFEHFEKLIAVRKSVGEQRAVKLSLIRYLYQHVPGLYRPQAAGVGTSAVKPLLAIRSLFNRKLKAWIAGERNIESISDERFARSGRKPPPIPSADRALLITNAVACDGATAQAFRRLHMLGQFSKEFSDKFPFDPQDKSRVPRALLTDVQPDIRVELLSRRGPHYTQMEAPKTVGDYRNMAPYDDVEMDDATWNHPFAIRDRTGKVLIRRGECILSAARRVNYILHHTLIAGIIDGEKSSFNAWHVRGHILALHDKVGLPHRGLSLEHNVFAARLIRGDQRPHWRDIDTRSFEPGLRHAELEMQLHYHHPGTPWTKRIERIIGMVQDRMDCEPGYVGRNQRLDRRENAEQLIHEVEAGKKTPEEAGILWFDQFARLLDAVITEYNREIQNGELLMDTCGLYLSPEDAFINGICGKPGIKHRPAKLLTPQARALLSTHQRKMYVGDRGIELDLDRRKHPYWDENLEPYRHKDVLVYLNIEVPAVVICSDLKKTHFFPVKCQRYDAFAATSEQLRGINSDRGRFMARSKVIQSNIRPPVISLISRDSSITAPTRELGDAVNAAVETHKADEARTQKEQKQLNRMAGALGSSIASKPLNPSRVRDGADMTAEAQAEIAAMKESKADE